MRLLSTLLPLHALTEPPRGCCRVEKTNIDEMVAGSATGHRQSYGHYLNVLTVRRAAPHAPCARTGW